MDFNSTTEMSTLHHDKATSKPAQASNLNTSFPTRPLLTRSTPSTSSVSYSANLPPGSTPNCEPNSLANRFVLPFQTLVVRSHTTDTTVKLYVRESTLYRIPFFSKKLESGDLRNDEYFHMLDKLDDANSLGLLFGFVEKGTVPSLIGPIFDVDAAEKDESVSNYVRAYPLAGKLELEEVQNSIVDSLVAYYLEYTVSATDIGILIQAGAVESKLGKLLMHELARSIIDGSDCESLQHEKDSGIEKSDTNDLLNEGQDISTGYAQDSDNSAVSGLLCQDTRTLVGKNPEPHFQPLPTPHANFEPLLQDHIIRQFTTHSSTRDTVFEQIQRCWTIKQSATLMKMMVKAHHDAKNPVNRSPMELAAADPCTVHTHSITEVCTRHEPVTGQKRKRPRGEYDGSDEDGNGNGDSGSDGDDDSDSVHSSSSRIGEEQNEAAKTHKENIKPGNGTSTGPEKEVGDHVKQSGPLKKRRKLGWWVG